MEFQEYINKNPNFPPSPPQKKDTVFQVIQAVTFLHPQTLEVTNNLWKGPAPAELRRQKDDLIFSKHMFTSCFFIFSTFNTWKKDWVLVIFSSFVEASHFFRRFFFGAWMHVERHEDTNSVVALHRSYHLAFQEKMLGPEGGEIGWFGQNSGRNFTSWWLNQPQLKNMIVKIGSSSPIFRVKIKNLWNHQPVQSRRKVWFRSILRSWNRNVMEVIPICTKKTESKDCSCTDSAVEASHPGTSQGTTSDSQNHSISTQPETETYVCRQYIYIYIHIKSRWTIVASAFSYGCYVFQKRFWFREYHSLNIIFNV